MNTKKRMQVRFNSALAAKFAREKLDRPKDWVIAPQRGGWYELHQIGGFNVE